MLGAFIFQSYYEHIINKTYASDYIYHPKISIFYLTNRNSGEASSFNGSYKSDDGNNASFDNIFNLKVSIKNISGYSTSTKDSLAITLNGSTQKTVSGNDINNTSSFYSSIEGIGKNLLSLSYDLWFYTDDGHWVWDSDNIRRFGIDISLSNMSGFEGKIISDTLSTSNNTPSNPDVKSYDSFSSFPTFSILTPEMNAR